MSNNDSKEKEERVAPFLPRNPAGAMEVDAPPAPEPTRGKKRRWDDDEEWDMDFYTMDVLARDMSEMWEEYKPEPPKEERPRKRQKPKMKYGFVVDSSDEEDDEKTAGAGSAQEKGKGRRSAAPIPGPAPAESAQGQGSTQSGSAGDEELVRAEQEAPADEKDKEIEQLKALLEKKDDISRGLRSEVEQLRSENALLKEEQQKSQRAASDLQKQAQEKDEIVEELERALKRARTADLSAEVEAQAQIKARDNQLRRLSEQHQELREKAERREAEEQQQQQQQQREVAELVAANQRAEAANADLQQALDQTQQGLAEARSVAEYQHARAIQAEAGLKKAAEALKEEKQLAKAARDSRSQRLEEHVEALERENGRLAEELRVLAEKQQQQQHDLAASFQRQIEDLRDHAERRHEEVVGQLKATAEHRHYEAVAALVCRYDEKVEQLVGFAQLYYQQAEIERAERQQAILYAEQEYAKVLGQRDEVLARVTAIEAYLSQLPLPFPLA